MKINLLSTLLVCLIAFSQHSLSAIPFLLLDFYPANQLTIGVEEEGTPPILVDAKEHKGVLRAIAHLQADAKEVTGITPPIVNRVTAKRMVIIGSIETSQFIQEIDKLGKIDLSELQGEPDKYLIQTIKNPLEGVDEALVIVGSDKQGTLFGIYELSTQMAIVAW
ncbi:MAG: alpha-glucuronidase family glycosyl hydrolase [Phocaeicola sp.]